MTEIPQAGEQWDLWVFDFGMKLRFDILSVKNNWVHAVTEDRRGTFQGSVQELQDRGERVAPIHA